MFIFPLPYKVDKIKKQLAAIKNNDNTTDQIDYSQYFGIEPITKNRDYKGQSCKP